MKRRLFTRLMALSILLAIVLPGGRAWANGCYFPQQAFPVSPAVPTQRALIVFRDGAEALVVESTFESQSPEVAWVVPLPAKPTQLEVGEPGMLTSLFTCLAPTLTNDLSEYVGYAMMALLALIPITLVAVFARDHNARRRGYIDLFGVYVILLLVAGIFLPALGVAHGGSASAGDLTVTNTTRVGSYDVAVLRAKNAQAVSAWLTNHALAPLTPAAAAAVEDYIARNWCFVVAKLRRDPQGPHGAATPHPIQVTFPVAAPVFPMRLTALAGSITAVELAVIADRQASADGFRGNAADRYSQAAQPPRYRIDDFELIPELAFTPESTGMAIGSPDVNALMWDGCIVTKISARFSPGDMTRDVALTLGDLKPHRDHAFTGRGRRELCELILLGGGSVVMIALAMLFQQRRRPTRREIRVLAGTMAGLFLATGMTFALLPTVESHASRGSSLMFERSRLRDLQSVAAMMVKDGRLDAGLSPREVADFPARAVAFNYMAANLADNPFTGQPTRCERSQGNVAIRRVDGKAYLCTYDHLGREVRLVELPAAAPGPYKSPHFLWGTLSP